MHEPFTPQLERSTTLPSLAPQARRLVPAPDRRGLGRQQSGCQPGDTARADRGRGGSPAPTTAWHSSAMMRGTAGSPPQPLTLECRGLSLRRPGLGPLTERCRHSPGVWQRLLPRPCRPFAQSAALEPTKARAAGLPARRSSHGALVARDLAGHRKGAPDAPLPAKTYLYRRLSIQGLGRLARTPCSPSVAYRRTAVSTTWRGS
jgi:hypothetical protein